MTACLVALLLLPHALAAEHAQGQGAARFPTTDLDALLDPESATAWAAANGLDERRESFEANGQRIDLRFLLRPGPSVQAERIVSTTREALGRLCDWYGPYPDPQITIVEAPWNSGQGGAALPGIVVIARRWLEKDDEAGLERQVIAGLARQHWFALAPAEPADRWFVDGLARHAAVRAINEGLDGRHLYSIRMFGGFVPYTVRSLQLSRRTSDPRPPVRDFSEIDAPAWNRQQAAGPAGLRADEQAALALLSLERYIGWPALQQALAELVSRFRLRHPTASDLSAIVSEQRGTDMSWFFAEAFRSAVRFDYGIESFDSEPAATPSAFRTVVQLRRFGDGVFAGTSQPPASSGVHAPALPIEIRFADGRLVQEWWDGRQPQLTLEYETAAAAVAASVDPDAMLLLDADRTNNTRLLAPRLPRAGTRRLLSWLVWLQDLVLTCTAVV